MSITTALETQKRRLEENEKGFTLIELLVVVIIIGILAAIAIPVFLGQQASARDAEAQSNLSTGKVAYISYLVGVPAGATPTDGAFAAADLNGPQGLSAFGWPANADIDVVRGGAAANFCFEAEGGTGTFHVTAATNAPATGPCPPLTP